MKKILLFSLLLSSSFIAAGQGGYYFGVKGGLCVGFQNWSGIEQDPAYKYSGDLFIESRSVENKFGLFAQLGYHVKGSALRNRRYRTPIGGFTSPPAREFLFNNIVLGLGAKQKFDFGERSKLFYSFGVRVEYTVSTNLGDYTEINQILRYYPFDDDTFIRKINYGVLVGGGIEMEVSDYFGLIIELTINPDFSNQYEQPAIPNVTDPYSGQSRTLPERKIKNISIELSLGFRFLRNIEYID